MNHEELLEAELARQKAARKQAEALLEQKSLELYERNEELRREIKERQKTGELLQQQAEALARSNHELEQFAYAASHDLQAPLRSITGFSQLLMKHSDGKLDKKCDEFLEHIESSARHLHLLVNDLLEYSRIGLGEDRMGWADAGDAAREAAHLIAHEVKRRHAAILHANLPRVWADRHLLVQVFEHLIDNAIKYSRDEVAPEIRITADQREGSWEFAVSDNGIGMEPDQTERIFTIFQRLHTLDRYEGTGIGLSICKKIVERHGGRIWAESRPGKGSTFRFTLAAPPAE